MDNDTEKTPLLKTIPVGSRGDKALRESLEKLRDTAPPELRGMVDDVLSGKEDIRDFLETSYMQEKMRAIFTDPRATETIASEVQRVERERTDMRSWLIARPEDEA